MNKQGNLTKTKSLTKDVARYVCEEIMGFKYSHHDNNVLYEDYNDKVPQIYFYQGMSPSIMKLNTVTGDVRYSDSNIDEIYDLSVSIFEILKSNNQDTKIPKPNEDVIEFRGKSEKVKQYLMENGWL